MLKISGNTESTIQPGEGVVGVGGDSRIGRDRNKHNKSEIDDGEISSGKINNEVGKKDQKTSKSKNLFKSKKSSKSKKVIGSLDFLIPRAKLAFIKLRQVFLKALIPYHFDLECHIRIETDASGYVIGRILSQLTSDDLG